MATMIRHPAAVCGAEQLFYFRRTYQLADPGRAAIRVMAEARYKLWINGYFVACGPLRGNRHMRYYDEWDVTPFLVSGNNEFRVTLLGLEMGDAPEQGEPQLCGVLRSAGTYLAIDGSVIDGGDEVAIVTDAAWECAEETHVRFTPQFAVGMNEHIEPGFGTDLKWVPARPLRDPVQVVGDKCPFGVVRATMAQERTIPPMTYIPGQFTFRDGYYDAGELMTGYLVLRAKGKGKITLTCGECFVRGNQKEFVKGDRTDTTGYLAGHDDTFVVAGELTYESFWFRTFRYVRIVTEGSVEIQSLEYRETGYPLSVSGQYDFGGERENALWAISLRTLRRCMQETYTDCPYYEQLQYCMDTYSQMLYTFMITDDTRLARRAIEDFAMSWRPGYLTEARAPATQRQYIPGFSLFYILMLNMYEARTGKWEDIRPYLPVMDGILDWFDRQRNGAGLIATSDMWDFVDWADPWRRNEGAPVVEPGAGIAVYSLMYVYTLRRAARLQRLAGRGAVAAEYEIRADEMAECVQTHCYDAGRGLYTDSEQGGAVSQHTQIWAVLAELVDGDAARDILRRSLALDAKAGYAYAYLWFRALEKADCYELSEEMMQDFYALLDKHCTTIPETPLPYSRSECHAWGAVALYEFTTMILGVKLTDDKTRSIVVSPRTAGRDHAAGDAYTKWGRVRVRWAVEEDRMTLEIQSPDTVPVEVTVPRGYAKYVVLLNGKQIPPLAIR